MGCIYRRGQTYWVKYYRNGKPFQESSHGEKMEVAKRLLKLREGEISQGKFPGICFEQVKIDQLLGMVLADYHINNNKRSTSRAERSVGFLKREFEGLRAVDVNTPRITQYIENSRAEGMANSMINRELAALKRAFRLAARCTPPMVAQVLYIPMLKENDIRKGFIEEAEYQTLFVALPSYIKPVLAFGYLTGWCKLEILGLKWNQVNLREGIVRLEKGETKNGDGRTLYMEPDLLRLIRDLHRKRRMDCLHVFHRNGKPIGDFRKVWDTAGDSIKKPRILFHDLRRSSVRNMVRAWIPERVAMTISGHKTRSVFTSSRCMI